LNALNRIVSSYIEFAELQALNRKPMTMSDWIAKLDDFLKLSGRDLLMHAGKSPPKRQRKRPNSNTTPTAKPPTPNPAPSTPTLRKRPNNSPAAPGNNRYSWVQMARARVDPFWIAIVVLREPCQAFP